MYFNAGSMRFRLNDKGYVESIICDELEYLPQNLEIPFVRVIKNGQMYLPTSLTEESNTLSLHYGEIGSTVYIKLEDCTGYITIEVIEIEGVPIDTLIWGPYATTIKETIGEIIGVVRDSKVAIGMQALNIKTLAGWPREVQSEFDDQSDKTISSVSVCEFKSSDLAALPAEFGSIIQAYCRDRSKEARRNVWGKEDVLVEPLDSKDPDRSIIGSKIALFGCKEEEVLALIGKIEIAEGLPHPLIDGEWVKTSRKAMVSYLITDFSQKNMSLAIETAKKAGFEYMYHPEPFKTWGHFSLRDDYFPDGEEGFKVCSHAAKEAGIGLGIHTLTTFTTLNDKYVTPIPDKRLAKVQTTQITEDIDETEECIQIKEGKHFEEVDSLGAVLLDDELIQYSSMEEDEGRYYLTGCVRGAAGTVASIHKKESNISKLFDYPYKVLFPNLELQDEYIERMVEIVNELDIKQISFDGLEGCLSTGHEDYSIYRMINGCYKGWDHEVINDSSRLHHYNWHIHTRTNWGEPWGANMREGQIDLREVNQPFYKRNLFPRMIGWFLLRLADKKFEATALDDVEWMLAKAAGYDAGFAACIDEKVIKQHGYMDVYLETIKQWERARRIKAFSDEQREKFLPRNADWHLKAVGKDEWTLYPVNVSKYYVCDPDYLQPGQPGGADWGYTNPFEKQPVHFRLKAKSIYRDCRGSIENLGFRVDNKLYTFKCTLEANQYLIYEGGLEARLCDENFNEIQKVAMSRTEPIYVKRGNNAIAFTCDFKGEEKPEAHIKFIVYGQGEQVKAFNEV